MCGGQHPLGVDEGAPTDVLPERISLSQAHLPRPLALWGRLPPNDARSLQGLARGWGRKQPQHRAQPGPSAPTTLGFWEPTHPCGACAMWGEGQGQGQWWSGLTRGRVDKAQQERQRQQQQIPHLEGARGPRELAGGWARPGSAGGAVQMESGTPGSGLSPGLGPEVLLLQM